MNYRHAYHAGNFADVVKHAVVALAVERLKVKEGPFCVIDTHAGVGRYDLAATAARKTGEFEGGIARLWIRDPASLPAELAPYLGVVGALNHGAADSKSLRWYPGSPQLVRSLLRPQDRLVAVELHPEDAAILSRFFARDRQVTVREGDGYTALKALLPPKERRGLVLIDPPFEERDEFARVVQGLREANRRWASGHYVIWYPVKDRPPVAAFHEAVKATGITRILVVELVLRAADDAARLNGAGLLLVNPLWPLEEKLKTLMPALAEILGAGPGGGIRVEWLVPEAAKKPAE